MNPTYGPPGSAPCPSEGGAFDSVRLAASAIGLAIIVLGVALCLLTFRKAWVLLDTGEGLRGSLDRIEKAVEGSGPVLEHRGPGTPAEVPGTLVTPPSGEEWTVRAERPIAILLFLVLLSILARIGLGLIGAGAKLASIGAPWRQMIRELAQEIRRTPAGR